jgi:hypothetical protein
LDAIVSFYNFYKNFDVFGFNGYWDEYFEMIKNGYGGENKN